MVDTSEEDLHNTQRQMTEATKQAIAEIIANAKANAPGEVPAELQAECDAETLTELQDEEFDIAANGRALMNHVIALRQEMAAMQSELHAVAQVTDAVGRAVGQMYVQFQGDAK